MPAIAIPVHRPIVPHHGEMHHPSRESGAAPLRRSWRPGSRSGLPAALVAAALVAAACDAGAPAATPLITPGTGGSPREVNIVARDYAYVPATVDLVPGETVTFHLLNGGLVVHEAILGDMDTQLAWEAAEAAVGDAPPGPTPFVSPPPGFDGVRIVAESGQRLDVTWTIPADAASAAGGWFVGCHIPGHWEKGMVVPVRFVGQDGRPLESGQPPSSQSPVPPVPPGSGGSAGG
jgi:uncharacterized cupredoxin-like copper-binding protein